MNLQFGAYLTGACGQSQALYEARNAQKRKRGIPAELSARVEAQIQADTAVLIGAQQSAGLSFILDPMLDRYFLFQSFVEGVPGAETASQEHWLNNNIFYRTPRIRERIDPTAIGFTKVVELPANRMVILPSPYALLMLSDLPAYTTNDRLDSRAAIVDLATLLKNEAAHLVSQGFTRIQYDEPAFVCRQSLGSLTKEDRELVQTAMEICGHIGGATTSLHTYFGDAGPLLPFLKHLPVDCIGVDATETRLSDIMQQSFANKELAVGLIDARSAEIEDPTEVAQLARRIAATAQPRALWVTPNTGLEHVGWTIGKEKIAVLGRTLE